MSFVWLLSIAPATASWSNSYTAQYDEYGCDRSYANDYGKTYSYSLKNYNPYDPEDQQAADEYFAMQTEAYEQQMMETPYYEDYLEYQEQYNGGQQAAYEQYEATYSGYSNYRSYQGYNGYGNQDAYQFDGLTFEQWKYNQLLNNTHRDQHYFLYENGAGCKSENNYNLTFEYFHVDCGSTGKCTVGKNFTIRGRCK